MVVDCTNDYGWINGIDFIFIGNRNFYFCWLDYCFCPLCKVLSEYGMKFLEVD